MPMTHTPSRRALLGAALAAPLAAPAIVRARSWPARPIRLVVPFAAGGAADTSARLLTPLMAEALGGANFVVENHTGGSGSLGGAIVARAEPDGHTLLWDASSHIVNHALLRGLAFDYTTAFAPVSQVVSFPQVIAVKADFPAHTLAEYLDVARARPGAVSVGTQGNATAGHLALVALQQRTGIQFLHAPYRGGAAAARDLAAGAIDSVLITALSAGPIVDAGRARFLAVTAPSRVSARPEVPTFRELGIEGLEISEWVGLFGPAGLAEAIATRLHEALRTALGNSTVQERLVQLVTERIGSSPAAFRRFVAEGREQMTALVRSANITLD
jgi:tripartite-type tricarboxylate transporter receptor subunit TctC